LSRENVIEIIKFLESSEIREEEKLREIISKKINKKEKIDEEKINRLINSF
jgi:hypothetical protein